MATPPTFTAGSILTATQMNAVGLWLVKSQTVGAGVSVQNVTSCFSADFDNYVVTVSNVATSVNGGTINFKLLSGTTPTSAGFYGNTWYVLTANPGAFNNATITNAAYAEFLSSTTSSTNYGKCEIQAPYATQWTRVQSFGADNNYLRWHSSIHQSATSYDGLQLIPSSGTMTGGTVRVYGMRN